MKDKRDGSVSEMKENYTRESVIFRGKRLFRFILQINHMLCTIRKYGGAMIGVRLITGENLILRDHFSHNLVNSCK